MLHRNGTIPRVCLLMKYEETVNSEFEDPTVRLSLVGVDTHVVLASERGTCGLCDITTGRLLLLINY